MSSLAAMSPEKLRDRLAAREARHWELYHRTAESRELTAGPEVRRETWRREEGWAARWWEKGAPRFAAASTPEALESAIDAAVRLPTAPAEPPNWPSGSVVPLAPPPLDPPPDLFDELARLVSTESRGEATLTQLSVRSGVRAHDIANGAGLEVSDVSARLDGHARAIGRRGARACDGVVVFRWDGPPDLPALARRLADRVTLPLSDRPAPLARGEWLLDPLIGATLLSALSPLFTGAATARWWRQGAPFLSPRLTIVDDATADARRDDEGTPTRRVTLVEEGSARSRLSDLVSARRAGEPSSGHGVRASFRTPPQAAPRRLFLATDRGESPADLLARVRRGIFASGLTAPPVIHLEEDRYELEFTGVAIIAGRAQAPVSAARASGRLSELLQRIGAISTDRQFFALPHLVGAPTLLVEHATFE
jgi:predicted Zn-dependent protease